MADTNRGWWAGALAALWPKRHVVAHAAGGGHAGDSPADFTLKEVEGWASGGKFTLEPHLRVAFSLLKYGNPFLIRLRTGMRVPASDAPAGDRLAHVQLPVLVGITKPLTSDDARELAEAGLVIPPAYVDRHDAVPLRYVTGHVKVSLRGSVDVERLQGSLQRIIASPLVADIRLPPSLLPCDVGQPGETQEDFGLPPDRIVTIDGEDFTADGAGTVIGIIDDGCAFANASFLTPANASRLLYVWDQGRPKTGPLWTTPTEYGYGKELANLASGGNPPPLDALLAKHHVNGHIDEDAVYDGAQFAPFTTIEGRAFNASTHGTHVMDVAVGNGRALFGRVGVAPAAEIIFVQLPPDLVIEGGAVLGNYIADGADYIFRRAAALASARGATLPVSINISFGNYLGSHDGQTGTEQALDDLLAVDDRAIVIAAGNGFAANCHARGTVRHATDKTLRWQVGPHDESLSIVEFWYTGPPDLELYLTPPAGEEIGPLKPGAHSDIVDKLGRPVGYADYVPDSGNARHQISITLNPTSEPAAASSFVPAPSGTWLLRLHKTKVGKANRFHAWIERDESRHGTSIRHVQSRFHELDADPRFTVAGFATGVRTLAVGGYNTTTGEIAEYSACGPTRPYPLHPWRRTKPEVCAPCATDARGRGVLSAATRVASRTRIAGTSIAAPHVAGLAALALQINRDLGNPPLPCDELRKLIIDGAHSGPPPGTSGVPLRANRHQAADVHQPIKQGDPSVWTYLVGRGRADAWSSLEQF